ncbi:hypothetical protein H4F33_06280 [Pectobacterium brasiliense]|uniref:Uncharacterized protein n=1 Tax=Pectobacterium brasiliense TaxID=180957 RepID=A0AAE2WBU0_9GAMM|nr:hypothetical protein [Pectobacterium brasiliense]MBA0217422.1 hypothetical protein [Pectobacterium brasiliense]MBN3050430.1 hypothetical protein [Pectobacterium brasiliense]MBN3071725.1 hypothetical protein [Pectobacterium brasiliense]MBN3168582.1 hypothetical protein [Pectobacterium brasiliense]
MKSSNILLSSLLMTALFASASANAGPKFNVTFKNLGASSAPAAVFSPMTTAEIFSQANASPKPKESVRSGDSDQYTISNPISDVGSMHVRYKVGAKVCQFDMTYTVKYVLGNKIPQWTKSTTPSNGARCDLRVTYANVNTHDSDVEISIR